MSTYTETQQDKQSARQICGATNELHDPKHFGSLTLPSEHRETGRFFSSRETTIEKGDKRAPRVVEATTASAVNKAVVDDQLSARHPLADAAGQPDSASRQAAFKGACAPYSWDAEEAQPAATAKVPKEPGASLSNLEPLSRLIENRKQALNSY